MTVMKINKVPKFNDDGYVVDEEGFDFFIYKKNGKFFFNDCAIYDTVLKIRVIDFFEDLDIEDIITFTENFNDIMEALDE